MERNQELATKVEEVEARLEKLEGIKRQAQAGKYLAHYFLEGCPGRYAPGQVILAVCEACWPERTFRLDEDMADDHGYYDFDAAIDIKTGENAADLWTQYGS